jgi:hypothetical protein
VAQFGISHNIPDGITVKRQIATGYKERRDFCIGSLLKMLIDYSPVDRGEFKGAWRVSGSSPERNHDGVLDPNGEATLSKGLAALRGISAFGHVHINNTAPHFGPLERGHSGQAPAGVVRVIVPVFKAIFKDIQ